MFDPLLDLLKQNGVLDDEQIAVILDEQKNDGGKPIRQLVIDGGYVSEDDLLGMMAAYQGCEVVDLASMELDADTVISAYEYCFSLIADCLPDLRAFYVLVSRGTDELRMRLMLRTEDLSRASIDCFPDVAVRPESHVSIEDGDVVVVLRFAERGRAS